LFAGEREGSSVADDDDDEEEEEEVYVWEASSWVLASLKYVMGAVALV
jgi:hypothetical protein